MSCFFVVVFLTLAFTNARSIGDWTMSNRIYNYTEKDICSTKGCRYKVPREIPDNCLQNCEHGWYLQNKLLVDSTRPHTGNQSDVVVNVTPQDLITRVCHDDLTWKMRCGPSERCFFSGNELVITIDVECKEPERNETKMEQKKKEKRDTTSTPSNYASLGAIAGAVGVFIFGIVGIIFIGIIFIIYTIISHTLTVY